MAKNNNDPHIAVVNFKLFGDTKGAVRYQEVDDAGNPKTNDATGALVASLYLRKAALEKLGKDKPKALSIRIDVG